MEKKQVIMIIVVVVCLGAAGVIYMTTSGGGGGGTTGKVLMICEDGTTTFEIKQEEYIERLQVVTGGAGGGPMGPMPMMQGPIGIPCDECGGGKAYVAYRDADTGKVYPVGVSPQR